MVAFFTAGLNCMLCPLLVNSPLNPCPHETKDSGINCDPSRALVISMGDCLEPLENEPGMLLHSF